jgi:dTDP-4-dehydrorhamnose 3,5-epimerase
MINSQPRRASSARLTCYFWFGPGHRAAAPSAKGENVPSARSPPPGFTDTEMPEMQIERFNIPDIFAMVLAKRADHRGYFSETYRRESLAAEGVNQEFVQENHVYSAQRGVVRGLHFQIAPHPQGKLVRCVRGAILDIGVDIRKESPCYGRHVAVELSAANWKQLWLPPGFAHGYLTLEPDCEVIYKVTDYWAPECERGIAWDDPALGIDWRIPKTDVILTDKDRSNPPLAEVESSFDQAAPASR